MEQGPGNIFPYIDPVDFLLYTWIVVIWMGLNQKELIASLVIGILGATAGGFEGYRLQYMSHSVLHVPVSEIVPYTLPAGIISGFACCFYLSAVYLKRIRGDKGKKHFAYGWLFGICAGAASGVIVAIFYVIGLYLTSVPGSSLLGPNIFMILLSIVLGAFTGAAIGLTVSIVISLVFGLWILKRLA